MRCSREHVLDPVREVLLRPQCIAYERVDEQLTAEISFIDGGQPQRYDFMLAY